MVLTLDEVKSVLGITTDTEDARLAALIRSVAANIHSYTRNCFLDARFVVSVKDPYFHAAQDITEQARITSSAFNFSEAGFFAGMDFAILGAAINDGVKRIAAVDANELKLERGDVLYNENYSGTVIFQRVIYPADVQDAAMQMVVQSYRAGGSPVGNVTSEKVGEYSVSFSGGDKNMFPVSVQRVLNGYRKARYFTASGGSVSC